MIKSIQEGKNLPLYPVTILVADTTFLFAEARKKPQTNSYLSVTRQRL